MESLQRTVVSSEKSSQNPNEGTELGPIFGFSMPKNPLTTFAWMDLNFSKFFVVILSCLSLIKGKGHLLFSLQSAAVISAPANVFILESCFFYDNETPDRDLHAKFWLRIIHQDDLVGNK